MKLLTTFLFAFFSLVSTICYAKSLPDSVISEESLGSLKTVHISTHASQALLSRQAKVELVIKSLASNLKTAIKLNSKKRDKIRSLLLMSGVSKQDMVDGKFSLLPDYGVFTDNSTGQKAENKLSVIVNTRHQMTELLKIVYSDDQVFIASNTSVEGDRDVIAESLRKQAIENADKVANIYESRRGVKLTPVSFKEDFVDEFKVKVSPHEREHFGQAHFNMNVTVSYQKTTP